MGKKRVRLRLLLLLWIWALVVFTVVDLFRDVPEFDRVRPRAPLYEGMRAAAHEIVGEPYRPPADCDREPRARPPSDPPRGHDAAVVLEPGASGPMLLEVRDRIPPELLGAYGAAAAAAAVEAPEGEREALAVAALDAQAQALLLASPDWGSARITIERLAFIPGYEERFANELVPVRHAVARGLRPEAPLESLAEAVQLASLCGDEGIAAACRTLLPHEPRRPRTREEALVQEHAARAVARWGNEQDRVAVTVWLERALAAEEDPARRLALSRQLEDAAAPRAP